MSRKPGIFFIFLIIVLVNVVGLVLKYFNLDTYFILIGFRFHLSILISFLLILGYINFNSVKEMFIHPEKQKYIFILLLVFLPLLFIPLDIFILKQFKVADQDYFFEFGLSSIVDYPIYLIWNVPQLFMFFIFMNTILESAKYKFIKASLLTLFLFLFEIIPTNEYKFNFTAINYFTAASFLITAILTGLYISRVKNIYLFAVMLFSVLWGTILSFGSSSETIINILLASQYQSWQGFINPGKKFEYTQYLTPMYILLIVIFSFIIFKRNRKGSIS